MRVYSVARFIPPQTDASTTIIDFQGKTHHVLEDALCRADFADAFHNPERWSQQDGSRERRKGLHDSPTTVEFVPNRWLFRSLDEDESKGGDTALHIPRSQGSRSCPTKTFVQMEMTAIMATGCQRIFAGRC